MYRNFRLVVCAAAAALCAWPAATAPSGRLSSAREVLRNLPVRFEGNAGQWDPGIRFRGFGTDCSVVLTDSAAELLLPAATGTPGRRLRISLAGANASPAVRGLEPLPGRSNYLLGNRTENWRWNVPQYGRVRYERVYSGIDLEYYGSGGKLEYDFLVRPGADPRRIRLDFSGADRISLTPEGDLSVRVGEARFLQRKPVLYQADESGARRPVPGRYRIVARRQVAIEAGPYDRARTLVIDPVLVYSSLIGGSGDDQVNAVAVDRQGFIYIAGSTTPAAIAIPDTAFQSTHAGGSDGFVARIDPNASGDASLVYFTYLGGTGSDSINAMAIDNAGNVFLTGSTDSTDFPLAGTAVQSAAGGSTDAFVTQLRPSLGGKDALLYSGYLGGAEADVGNAIAVDNKGVIYIVGTTRSDADTFPLTASAYQNARWGPQDSFIAKIDPNSGSPLVYSSFLGGETTDDGRAIALSPSGIVYLAGSTLSTTFPLAGAPYRDTPAGAVDVFVAQMDLTKFGANSLLYSTYLGGSASEEVRAIALDAQERVWVTGYTLSGDFPVTPDAFQSAPKALTQVFLTRLNPAAPRSAAVEYSTYLGGSGGEVSYGLTVDKTGSIYVTGYTLSPDFPVTPDALQRDAGGGVAVFLTKLDPAKTGTDQLAYSTCLGSQGVHFGRSVAVGPDGTMYVGGGTSVHNVPVTGGAFQGSLGGGFEDGFVIAVKPDTPPAAPQTDSGTQ